MDEWKVNQFVYDPGENGVEAVVRKIEGDSAVLELTLDYRTERNNVWASPRAIASRTSPSIF